MLGCPVKRTKKALQYRKRWYACPCGKRFAEGNPFVDKYQRFLKEWKQQVKI